MANIKPIVIDIKKDKKKKRKYSKGLKDVQRSGRSMTKISSRLVRALAKGVDTFAKESDKSAGKKRDGAMRDLGLNMAKGFSKTLRKSSRAPLDLAKALDSGSLRRGRRRRIKVSSRMARVMRLR